jgi:hypothetical protein
MNPSLPGSVRVRDVIIFPARTAAGRAPLHHLAPGCNLRCVLMFLVQFGGERYHPGPINLLEPLVLLVAVASVAALGVPVVERVVLRSRRAMRSRRGDRRRRRSAANAELRARALMSELCPHGWRAQITLFGEAEVRLGVARGGARDRVALDWTELRDESGRPAVMRRVWAPTIGEALDAMVADRRTDETLEQIEHGAVADGALWPDL